MSKPMLVTLPLLLLLFDYWPLHRFDGVPLRFRSLLTLPILDKVPLLLFSVVSSVVTLMMQRVTVDYANQLPVTARLSNSFTSYVVYVEQMFWPARLTVLYPISVSSLFSVKTVLAFMLITAVTAVAIALRRRIPYFLVGWSWYLVCLLPVIGLIQVGLQSHADRYTYLPQIGLAISLVWAGSDLLESVSKRKEIAAVAAVLVIGLLTWRAAVQTSYWRNTESLWTHALDVAPDNDVAHYNIAEQLLAQNRVDDAIAHYEKAINAFPHDPAVHYQLNPAIIHNALGNALARKGLFDDALIHYREAAELENDFADAHSNIAAMLVRQGHLAEAIAEYEKAVALPPEDADSHVRLAALFLQSGRADLAIAHYRRALELEPASVVARAGLSQCSRPAPSQPKGP
jgi:protein O-mannosyl-transferase